MKLPPPGESRSLAQKYMRTGRLPAISLDLHLDASGCDDWSSNADPWFILVCAVTRSSHRWKLYRQWHDGLPDGRLHLSERARMSVPDRLSLAHTALSFDACEYTFVQVTHKPTFCGLFTTPPTDRPAGQPESYWQAELLWTSFLSVAISIIRNEDRMASIGDHKIRKIYVNNPGRGRIAERVLINPLSTTCAYPPPKVQFVPGGHAGIDLADTYAWSFRRFLTHNCTQQFPFAGDSRHFRLVLQIGAANDHVTCTNLDEFKKYAVSIEPTACREKTS